MNLGMTELIIVFAIILVLFGGKKLPGLGKALGDSIRGFKSGLTGEADTPVERQAQLPHEHNNNLIAGQKSADGDDLKVTDKDKINRS